LVAAISATGATPEMYSQLLTYSKLVNSDRLEDKRTAYTYLLNELKALGGAIGEVLPGDDPLRGHDDLRTEVAAKTLSPERAAEIARGRNATAAAQTHTQHANSRQESEAQFSRAAEQAKQDLNTLGNKLAADPDYDRKYAILVPALKPVFAELHPSKWAGAFQRAYNDLKLPAAPVAAPKIVTPTNQPLRANKTPAGGGVAQPKSMHEAVLAGLNSVGR
jgi:hypothetical protein